ncbi:unnamed protein product [Withania somnifera]
MIALFGIVILALIYKAIMPPAPKICGSPNGPLITAPRVKLSDGRYLAYKENGVPRDQAKHKFVFIHGFDCVRHDIALLTTMSPELIQSLGIYIVSIDRPGYGESDPHPKRTPKTLALDIEELADQLELGAKFYDLVRQQGDYESIHRDLMIGFWTWEFDPMELVNPFPNGEGSVHIWQGDEDGHVPVILQRYIAKKLPWIHYHEMKGGGHMFPWAEGKGDKVMKTFLLGEPFVLLNFTMGFV